MTPDQMLDALESPRGRAALRNAIVEMGYGPVDARESVAGRIANIDSKIDGVHAGVQRLVADLDDDGDVPPPAPQTAAARGTAKATGAGNK
jgi:hypothetical protein